jgi:hypothetical protein
MTDLTVPMFYCNPLTAKSARAELASPSLRGLPERMAHRAIVKVGSLNSTPKPGCSNRPV